jgi:glycosyltransferase involved in cell wall biosynthesis
MRIAQIATVGTPVRPEGSDSIEQHVHLLSRELVGLGHKVTVFAARGSEVAGELVTALPGPYGTGGAPDDWQLCEWVNLCRAVEESRRFDLLHSHAYLWGLPLEPLSAAPMVHTLHVTPYADEARLRALYPRARITALSTCQWAAFPQCSPVAIIPHGVDPGQLAFQPRPQDYVCYLGRFTEGKGALDAVQVARDLGVRLLLAGPRNEFYLRHVAPHVDGRQVEYVGYVNGLERSQLLGNARALLYPIRAPEPFGLVQVEAMMCGTPVVAMRLGAVAEIVDEGVTGYTAASREEFAGLVCRSFDLDRSQVRATAEQRFSAARMAREYAHLYQRIIAESESGTLKRRRATSNEVPNGDADRP